MDKTRFQKLATLSHNRQFTLVEAKTYAGVTKPQLDLMVKRGLVEKLEGKFLLTTKAYEMFGG